MNHCQKLTPFILKNQEIRTAEQNGTKIRFNQERELNKTELFCGKRG